MQKTRKLRKEAWRSILKVSCENLSPSTLEETKLHLRHFISVLWNGVLRVSAPHQSFGLNRSRLSQKPNFHFPLRLTSFWGTSILSTTPNLEIRVVYCGTGVLGVSASHQSFDLNRGKFSQKPKSTTSLPDSHLWDQHFLSQS
jgi:hypothetical protein